MQFAQFPIQFHGNLCNSSVSFSVGSGFSIPRQMPVQKVQFSVNLEKTIHKFFFWMGLGGYGKFS
jgi:hypothetical protein